MADTNGTDNDDILVGGADDDSIYAYGGTDTVTDFTAGDGPTDKIDLDGLGPGWHWVKANSPGISMN